jgi:hypothetical protein
VTYTLVGFPKEDKQPMKAAFDMMAKAAQRARQALLSGDLSAYEPPRRAAASHVNAR